MRPRCCQALNHCSQHKAFPSSQSSLLLGDFRGFSKAVHFAEQIFPLWISVIPMKAALQIALCWRRNSADSALQSAQEWHRGGLGCEFLFIPLQWLREKGWLVCPTSKRCLLFGYRDKKAQPHVEESSHCHGEKEKQSLLVYLSGGRHRTVLRNVS